MQRSKSTKYQVNVNLGPFEKNVNLLTVYQHWQIRRESYIVGKVIKTINAVKKHWIFSRLVTNGFFFQ